MSGIRTDAAAEQGAAQRLEVSKLVLAVAALGPPRARIAEAPFPASKRVGG